LSRLFAKLNVGKQHVADLPVTGMVAAIVRIDPEPAPRSLWTTEYAEAVVARLARAAHSASCRPDAASTARLPMC
jgi:hypothetical protein